MADFKASAKLKGIDDLSRPFGAALRKAERKMGRSFGRMERMGLRMRRAFAFAKQGQIDAVGGTRRLAGATRRTVGTMAKLAGGTAAVGALALDRFGRFEAAVSRIGNLIDGDRDAVEEFGGQLKRLSLRFALDPIEAAEGAYMAFSGGVETSSAALAEFLPAAARLAKTGNTDLATAVDALTSLQNVFGKGFNTTEFAGMLQITERLGKTDPGQIAASIGQIAQVSKTAGVPLQETLGAIASLTKTGVSTSEAVTQINALIKALAIPTAKTAGNFEKVFGLEGGPEFIGQMGGIIEVMEAVRRRGPEVFAEVFGRRSEAIKGAQRLAQTGFDPLRQTAAAMGDAAKTAEKNWANMTRRTSFKVEQLKVGFGHLFGELGGGLAEGLGLGGGSPEDLANSFESAGDTVRKSAKGFAEGFITALAPAGDLANVDFASMAKSAGKAFGKTVTGLGKMASATVSVFETIADVVGATIDIADRGIDALDAPAELAAAIKRSGVDVVDLEDPTARARPERVFRDLKEDPAAIAAHGANQIFEFFTGGTTASAPTAPRFDRSRYEQLGANDFARAWAAAKRKQQEQQAAEIKIDAEIKLKGEGAKGAETKIKAKSKPGSKVRVGKVGKRRVGGG